VFVDEMVMRQSPGVVPVAAGESGRVVPLPALAAPPPRPARQTTNIASNSGESLDILRRRGANTKRSTEQSASSVA
jgi:hypothetical protein